MKRALILIFVALPIAAGIWYMNRPAPLSVPLSPVGTGPVEVIAANSRAGTIRACERSRLSMPQGGRVETLFVDEGDRVKTGQLLLKLYDDEQQALVAQADANLAAARLEKQRACTLADFNRRELKRSQSLAERNLVSDEQLDRLANAARLSAIDCERSDVSITQAQAELSLYTAQLDKRQLRAPFSGIVAEINGEPGEYTTPSPPGVATPPAVDLIDDSCLYVRAPIDEVEAAQLRSGQSARITLDAFRGSGFSGTVKRIAPFVSELEKQARTVDVDVYFDPIPRSTPLLVGYSADVEVIIERHENTLRIPTEALLEGSAVLRFDPASATLKRVSVDTGPANWSWTSITGGLAEGDQILTRLDIEGAVDGARVTPQ
ncbi:putative Co/Zn/Cd efflux system membrane fusion protein [Marinobacterium lacunae]|uniref:Putative Co/Zn/Cd efflux system membrane fusion protein n=1 Tax=Marinobacterium lacunae TaxID=1232683 RepID=A0A081G215_9GAMM|nr:efflux RND transporter periplasmic adaptor subunit [Marinobacterium lacunae]KEA64820.1 putative Co/Zn/Cd efflux system membrane fusion protein [Marinobacterium lacunae]